MESSGVTVVKVECASSLLPRLTKLVHSTYIDEIEMYHDIAFHWIQMAAYLTPKYWDFANGTHAITEMIGEPKRCYLRAEDYYRLGSESRRQVQPLYLDPTCACKYHQ